MSKATGQNLRLAILIAAILAGGAMQKHAQIGQHAGCSLCHVAPDQG